MKQGDIVLVPFPFTNLERDKERPALIIAKNTSNDDFIALAVTSKNWGENVRIDQKDLEKGALPIISFVRCDKVATLHKTLIRNVVGELNLKTFKKVIVKFKAQF